MARTCSQFLSFVLAIGCWIVATHFLLCLVMQAI